MIKGTLRILNNDIVSEPKNPNITNPVKLSTDEIPRLIIVTIKLAKNSSLKYENR